MALLATDADDDIPTPVTSPSQGPSGAPAPPSGSLASILERESAGYGWMKREWTLKMARAVADGFVENTKQYRYVEGSLGGGAHVYHMMVCTTFPVLCVHPSHISVSVTVDQGVHPSHTNSGGSWNGFATQPHQQTHHLPPPLLLH